MTPTALNARDTARPRLWIWGLALAAFYAAWLAIVATGHHWTTVRDHWGIAVAMLAGSYVAGSTPMGGGTVAFPILVLLLHQSPALGRDFSYAIQSVGMSSATLFMLCRQQPVQRTLLRWGMLGSLAGTPLGILLLAPHVPALAIKLLFAVVWAGFGVLHLGRTREFTAPHGPASPDVSLDRKLGWTVGFLGGATLAAVTGVGTEMLAYLALVLIRRADLKIAIPTAVMLAAFTSVVAILTRLSSSGVQEGVFEHWLAAAPIVVLGAPIGAYIVGIIGRTSTLHVVAVLCLGQFAWTLQQEWPRLGGTGIAGALAAVVLFSASFEALYRRGRQAPGSSPASPQSHA